MSLCPLLLCLLYVVTKGTMTTISLNKEYFEYDLRQLTKPKANSTDGINTSLMLRSHPTEIGGRIFSLPYTYLTLGTPAVTFKVAIDTGSAILFIPGRTCYTCFAQRAYFYDSSSTSEPVNCHVSNSYSPAASCIYCSDPAKMQSCYRQTAPCTSPCAAVGAYAEGSLIYGTYRSDMIHFGNTSFRATFGDMEYLSPFDRWGKVGLDGIWGLGSSGGNYHFPTVVQQWAQSFSASNKFGLYLGRVGECSGALTLGGADPEIYEGELTPLPMKTDSLGHYMATLASIEVGSGSNPSTLTGLAKLKTVFDSGATLAYLKDDVYDQLKMFATALHPSSLYIGLWDEGVYIVPNHQQPYKTWPNITFNLKTAYGQLYRHTLSPSHYILQVKKNATNKYWRIGFSKAGNGLASITDNLLGDTVLAPKYWLFDTDTMTLSVADVRSGRKIGNCSAVSPFNNIPLPKTSKSWFLRNWWFTAGLAFVGAFLVFIFTFAAIHRIKKLRHEYSRLPATATVDDPSTNSTRQPAADIQAAAAVPAPVVVSSTSPPNPFEATRTFANTAEPVC